MPGKFDCDEKKWNFIQVQKHYKSIMLDDSFQRRGGCERGSGWPKKNQQAYLKSAIEEGVTNSILLANVDECLSHAHAQNDRASIEYFEGVKNKGFKYVSIDGNNTSSTIFHFMENMIETSSGELLSDYGEEQRSEIEHEEKIMVYVFRKIGLDEMTEKFRNVNKSTNLNDQESRQARVTPLAMFVREVANESLGEGETVAKARVLFKNLIYDKETQWDKRKHEEITAQVALKREKGFKVDIKKTELDEFYDKNFDISEKTKKAVIELYDIVGGVATEVGPLSKKLGRGQFHALLDFVGEVVRKGYDIKKEKDFFDWFLKKDIDFSANASKLTEEQKNDSYNHWITTFNKHALYNKTNERFLQDFEELEQKGYISMKRKGHERASFGQKKQLFSEQEGFLRSGGNMSATDLYTGVLEADHVKSVKDGGETELENLELMTKAENRSKGSKSNESHFPFQKKT